MRKERKESSRAIGKEGQQIGKKVNRLAEGSAQRNTQLPPPSVNSRKGLRAEVPSCAFHTVGNTAGVCVFGGGAGQLPPFWPVIDILLCLQDRGLISYLEHQGPQTPDSQLIPDSVLFPPFPHRHTPQSSPKGVSDVCGALPTSTTSCPRCGVCAQVIPSGKASFLTYLPDLNIPSSKPSTPPPASNRTLRPGSLPHCEQLHTGWLRD